MVFEKIFEWLVDLVVSFFEGILTNLVPSYPQEAIDMISTACDYLRGGVEVLACYTNLEYLLVLLGVMIAADVGVKLYMVTMWVLRKIPILNIK